ncbi:Vesicular glutamate transporter 2 [Lamellibrachia satsuma]|nr:Vesicular glutamate transporter 2 [Lamellibrachia satsuma]
MITLTSIGMLMAHAMRVNMAVMVVTILDVMPHSKVGTDQARESLPTVMWDSRMIGFLHAAFYIGCFLTHIPGGYVTTKVPSHRVFGGCIIMSSALNLLIPMCIDDVGYAMTCVVRIIQGLAEGFLFPSCYAILRHWTTPSERSRMCAIVITGVYLGPVIGLIMSGHIAHYFAWQYIFYIHGACGMFWFILWLCLAYETPERHPTISSEEREFILEKQGETAIIYKNDNVPWVEILTSLPVNALNVCNFARSFIFYLLLTNEPTYLNVFNYTLAENGLLSALPHALLSLVALCSGPLADFLIGDPMLTPTIVRKLFTCIGFGLEASCLYVLAFVKTGGVALVFLTIGVASSGLTVSGWQINHLDLAPRYANVLVAITTSWGTVAGVVNPIIVGELTKDQTIDNWHNVFLMSASVLVFSVIFYLVFGSGERQVWAESKHRERINIDKSTMSLPQKPYGTFLQQSSNKDGIMGKGGQKKTAIEDGRMDEPLK